MTEKKEKEETRTSNKQQQHSDQGHCDGESSSSTTVMSIVKVDEQ